MGGCEERTGPLLYRLREVIEALPSAQQLCLCLIVDFFACRALSTLAWHGFGCPHAGAAGRVQ